MANTADTSAAEDPPSGAVIYVCITCRHADSDREPRLGVLFAEAVERAAAGTEVDVRRLRCFANCTRGASAALRVSGSWTYVFGGLDETCADALIVAVRMMAKTPDGILPWRGRPERLKRGMIARVPPMGFKETDA